jgi:hypothetical protein
VEGPIEDLPEDDDDLDYKPMEAKLMEGEALARAMAVTEAEERAKWQEEAIQRSQAATPAPAPLVA